MANTAAKRRWVRWLVPGFLFQSAVIGGGYGTGAEIRQYFYTNGFVGGLLGMIITTISWSLLCAVTFEFTRVFRTYDYRSMMGKLIGKASFLYEICYLVTMLIVLGVINATAGSMVNGLTGLSPWFGVALLSAGMIFLVFRGTETIEKVLSFWSYVLYAVYILFVIICIAKFGSTISSEFAKNEVGSGWFAGGAQYSFYNLGIVPALLYTVRDCESRKQTLIEGAIAGVIAIAPAAILLVVLAGVPATLTAEVPVMAIFDELHMTWLYVIFEIVLLGTLIETGTAFIKAMDDRIENTILERTGSVPAWIRPTVAAGLVVVGIIVSTFGLVPLIAKGYGAVNWGFLFIYVIPMLTIGIWKITKASGDKAAE